MSFSELQAEHASILGRFEGFQCDLMGLDWAAARVALDDAMETLAHHNEVEERLLMPIYEVHGADIEGGRPQFFRAEHDKLARLLVGLDEGLRALEQGDRASALDGLALIEQGFTFKHLWDHHTKREDAVFYPLLRRVMGEREQAELWLKIRDFRRES